MNKLLTLCILFAVTYSCYGAFKCVNLDESYGIIKKIRDCPEFEEIVNKVDTEVDNYLVCCPSEEQLCYTADGKSGVCVNSNQCPHITDMLKTMSTKADNSSTLYYIKHSLCTESNNQVKFCCSSPPSVETIDCKAKMSAFPPLPDSECCGVEARSGDKIVGGEKSRIDQYPWLVLLEYIDGNRIQTYCGGFLISGKYVLTAAHCVIRNQATNNLLPVNVRVGEYDTENDGPDCVSSENDCTLPAISIAIDQIIRHPEYNKRSKWDDIALIRLKETVNYTDFVRPICLPYVNINESAYSNLPNLLVAGWGLTENHRPSRYKLVVDVPLVKMETCYASYLNNYNNPPQLWTHQICAGGEPLKDSCSGDSGGPLMYRRSYGDKKVFEAVGMVSFGPRDCGKPNVPAVYTNVVKYVPWIRSQIKP